MVLHNSGSSGSALYSSSGRVIHQVSPPSGVGPAEEDMVFLMCSEVQ